MSFWELLNELFLVSFFFFKASRKCKIMLLNVFHLLSCRLGLCMLSTVIQFFSFFLECVSYHLLIFHIFFLFWFWWSLLLRLCWQTYPFWKISRQYNAWWSNYVEINVFTRYEICNEALSLYCWKANEIICTCDHSLVEVVLSGILSEVDILQNVLDALVSQSYSHTL